MKEEKELALHLTITILLVAFIIGVIFRAQGKGRETVHKEAIARGYGTYDHAGGFMWLTNQAPMVRAEDFPGVTNLIGEPNWNNHGSNGINGKEQAWMKLK